MNGYVAGDIMKRDVISVPQTMDLRDLAKLFLEKGISGAPVVDEDGSLAGVVSQTDLVYYNLTRGDELVYDSNFYHSARVEGQHVPRGFQFEDLNSGSVEDVMTPVVHSVTERASVETVARLMTRNHIHRVIVRKGKAVTGVISALDLLRFRGKSKTTRKNKNSAAKKKTSRARARTKTVKRR